VVDVWVTFRRSGLEDPGDRRRVEAVAAARSMPARMEAVADLAQGCPRVRSSRIRRMISCSEGFSERCLPSGPTSHSNGASPISKGYIGGEDEQTAIATDTMARLTSGS
jgi:hypothetical protein